MGKIEGNPILVERFATHMVDESQKGRNCMDANLAGHYETQLVSHSCTVPALIAPVTVDAHFLACSQLIQCIALKLFGPPISTTPLANFSTPRRLLALHIAPVDIRPRTTTYTPYFLT